MPLLNQTLRLGFCLLLAAMCQADEAVEVPTVAPTILASMPSDFPSLVPSGMPSGAPPTGGAMSDFPSFVPSQVKPDEDAPTANPTASTCDLCPQDMQMTMPEANFTNLFTGQETTCQAEQMLAQSGFYTQMECGALQEVANVPCGCEMIVTDAPTTAPTAAPVVNPTPQATRQPIAVPPQPLRFNPTAAPSATRYETTGQVYIELQYVADEMPSEFIDDFNKQITEFFSSTLLNLPNPIYNVDARLINQNIVESNGGRRELQGLRRNLQQPLASTLPPLLTLVRVTGNTESRAVTEEMNWILYYAVLNDSAGLVRILKQAESSGANLYFRPVDTIMAYNVDTFDAPAGAPTDKGGDGGSGGDGNGDDGDDGLSTGAIVGIIIGGVAAAALVVFAAVYTKQALTGEPMAPASVSGAASKSRKSAQEMEQEDDSDASSAPPPARPVITAASVWSSQSNTQPQEEEQQQQDASAQEGDDSVMNSEQGGDNMSYAYSLDPGNVDNQTNMTPATPLGTGESTVDDQTTEFSARPNMVSRQVAAPPGKLGIVIDTTLEGPVIHKVNPGSPLEGSVYPGDIIVAIDNVDTRAMSASAITALMVKTANQERRLTVLSEEEEPEEGE